jgi:predicted DNA-binding protein (MmcQ/YjbR family)
MFAATGLDTTPCTVNLKCDPEWSVTLREAHEDIVPGYHMNKTHWNTVNIENGLEESFIKKLIDHSYELVVKSLPKKDKMILDEL